MQNALKLNKILKILHFNYSASAIKFEFSSDYFNRFELRELKELAFSNSLNVTVKTAGAEDELGILNALNLGAKTIVVPLVESEYSIQKFISLVRKHSKEVKIFANIETIDGYNKIDEILKSSFELSGIVFGRSDMAHSLKLNCDDVNSPEIFKLAAQVSNKAKNRNLDFYIGGNVTKNSFDFFSNLPYLSGFETRKIVFNKMPSKSEFAFAINSALEFEIALLETKEQNVLDIKRLEIVKRRFLNN